MPEKQEAISQRVRQLGDQLNHIEAVLTSVRKQVEALQGELERSSVTSPVVKPSVESIAPPTVPPELRPKPALPKVEKQPRRSSRDWEATIGGNWFNKIGITAIILGVAFFLRYAIENEWIGNWGKVILGLIAGALLLVLGERFRRRDMKILSHGIVGGGLAILYLSLYFAFQIYGLISQPVAFALMVLVTLVAVTEALRTDSRVVLLFGLFGGFFTPFWVSTGQANAIALFTYVAILDLGLVAVAVRKNWRFVNLLCFAATAILYAGWHSEYYSANSFAVAEIYLTLFFAIFSALAYFINMAERKPVQPFDATLIGSNALYYCGFNLSLLESIGAEDYQGLFTAAMAVLYFALSWIAWRRNREDKLLCYLLLGAGITFTTLIFPIEFESKWLALAWLVEAHVLVTISSRLGLKPLYGMGALVWIAALFQLLIQVLESSGTHLTMAAATAFGVGIVATLCSLFLRSRVTEKLPPHSRFLLTHGLDLATLMLLPFLLPKFWSDVALVALMAVLFFVREMPQPAGQLWRRTALLFLPLAAIFVFFHELRADWINLTNYLPVLNSRFLLYIGAAALLAFLLFSQKTRIGSPGISKDRLYFQLFTGIEVVGLIFAALTIEVISFYDFQRLESGNLSGYYSPKQMTLSVIWSVYSLSLLLLGIWKQSRFLRFTALAIFAVTMVKVTLVDFWLFEKLYRIITAIVFGAILVYASYLYQRYKDKILALMLAADEGK